MKCKFRIGDYVKCIVEDIEDGHNYTRKAKIKLGDVIRIEEINFYVEDGNEKSKWWIRHNEISLKAECFELVKREVKEYGISKWLNNLKGGNKCQTK